MKEHLLKFLYLQALILVNILVLSCGSDKNTSPDKAYISTEETALDKLVTGKMAYSIPDEMKVEKQYKATLTVTEAISDSILFMNLDSTGYIKNEIKVSSKVSAYLIDPTKGKNFTITTYNSVEQFVGIKSNTTWTWNIIPVKKGNNELILRVTVKVLSDMGEVPKDVPVFEKSIKVKTDPAVVVKKFFIAYWQWTFGTILIPFVIWFFKSKKDKRKRK
jgi:hypothetical protein